MARTSKESQGSIFPSSKRPRSNGLAVAGSSLLWAWGFICYLSPTLFPDGSKTESVGLEIGFFISQACIVASACLLLASPALRRAAVRRFMPASCAFVSSCCTLLLAVFVASECMAGIVVCGVLHGICVPLLGAAWGARYSIGSRGMQPLIVLSFLIAYALYFAVPFLPCAAGIACVAAMPVLSWGLWRVDARGRDVFRCDEAGACATGRSHGVEGRALLDELFDGSWELSGMPWRVLAAVLLAAFVGNMVASAAMGFSYENADGLFKGGAFVCACIATMALVPLTSDGQSLGAATVYRITLTFAAIGLVGMLASNGAAVSLCGALVQGCAFFLQVLVFISVSRATWEKALSPLLSFCLAQAVIAAVVVAGNMAGKQVSVWEACRPGAFEWACGAAMLVLFFVLVKQAGDAELAVKAVRECCCAADSRKQGGAGQFFAAMSQIGARKERKGGYSHTDGCVCPGREKRADAVDRDFASQPSKTGIAAPFSCENAVQRGMEGGFSHAACPVGSASTFDVARASLRERGYQEALVVAGASSGACVEGAVRSHCAGGTGASRDEDKAARFAASFGLTKRESEVFSYLSKGRSLPYIADELFVTTGTVKTHTAHIYRKLGVKSKQELLDMFEGWDGD